MQSDRIKTQFLNRQLNDSFRDNTMAASINF